MKEIWKDIVGYEEYYQVSNLGRVRRLSKLVNVRDGNRLEKEKIRKLVLYKGTGYYHVNLSRDNKTKQILIHRLVAKAFIPNPGNKPCVNHIDGNKANNAVDNLEWCTYSENTKHAYSEGLLKPIVHKDSTKKIMMEQKQGEKCYMAILKDEDIPMIRQYREDGLSCKEIGEIFGVSRQTISSVVFGRTWKHL